MAYLLQILVVLISPHIKLGANKQITRLALYTMISPEQKEDITRGREDMNFIFEWQNNILRTSAASE